MAADRVCLSDRRVNAREEKFASDVNEVGGRGVLFLPYCAALMVAGLCGGAGYSYNGGSFFAASFILLKHG
jgi:hypothetical protein